MSSHFSRRTGALPFLALTLLALPLALNAPSASAQSADQDCNTLPTHAQAEDCARTHSQAHTIELHNVTSYDEANEIATAVRNASDPSLRAFLLPNGKELVVNTYPAEFARVEALLLTLDRPHKAYRLAYTITEVDGDKIVSTQHMSMVAVIGQHTSVKEGDKVPVATGSYAAGGGTNSSIGVQTQFTYLDVGMNFDATIEQQGEGVSLKSKVEQSSVGPSNTIAGVQEPVIRQTVLEGFALLTLGKPVMLGSIDVPTTTHRFDIAVVLQTIK